MYFLYFVNFLLSLFIVCCAQDNASKVLVDLTSNYDKLLRPNYAGEPINVAVGLFISSISAVSEINMDFTVDMYLRKVWNDTRLNFNYATGLKKMDISFDYAEKLWIPDIYFPNAKRSHFHEATTHNAFLKINQSGKVFISERITITAVCDMRLRLFPFDSQRCNLYMESYAYTTADMTLCWVKPVDMNHDVRLPQFLISHVILAKTIEEYSVGNYTRLRCSIILSRNLGFYLIQIYLPAILIVLTSWVTFWFDRDATPARVAIGVTTVLAMTTLISGINAHMPKVSYVKSVDIFMGMSFLMVFASFLEYASVRYTHKHPPVIRKIRSTTVCDSNWCPEDTTNKVNCTLRPSCIDKCSRVIFPLIFCIFNVLYWSFCTLLAQKQKNKYVADARQADYLMWNQSCSL